MCPEILKLHEIVHIVNHATQVSADKSSFYRSIHLHLYIDLISAIVKHFLSFSNELKITILPKGGSRTAGGEDSGDVSHALPCCSMPGGHEQRHVVSRHRETALKAKLRANQVSDTV